MKKVFLSLAAATIITILAATGYTQNASDYLVCQDIGGFKKYGCACGTGAGILVPADHFGEDHNDISCTVIYHSMAQRMGIDVELTKHSGSDSDKWLLHEIDREFRNYYGIPGKSYGSRQINGQTIIENLVAGGSYRWIGGTKVIVIEYHDSQMTKPEPNEVIQAYLTKHPSTMQAFTLADLRSNVNKTTWIKDEMDRRLWLCDKWFMQLQLRKTEEKQVYQETVKSMNIFLDYREKYYGQKAVDDKNLLASYLNTNNGTGIKAKHKEYKDWWVVNKEKAISL